MNTTLSSALLTDLYQLSMMQVYYRSRMEEQAVFELFVRKLPDSRNFLVASGIDPLLDYLESVSFTHEEIQWLRGTQRFSDDFLVRLASFRFTGDIYAVPEGTLVFPDEPIVQVIAPLPEAQLVESRLINLIHFQTVIASKAARTVLVAPEKLLVDFGLRRAHGSEAGLLTARASYVAGFSGTSTVLAGAAFNIPVFGTMAHSFIQAHEDEAAAFADFANSQSQPATFLIDTYDTERAARKVAELVPALEKRGLRVGGVRLDSGNLSDHSRNVRAILDQAGFKSLRIFVSGNLDEHAIAGLLTLGAPIDGFGVGTKLTTSSDAPYLDCAYKIQEYAGKPKRKRSEGKSTWPGRKQVYRYRDSFGTMQRDLITLFNDPVPRNEGAHPLLVQVMSRGKRINPPCNLKALRSETLAALKSLPASLRSLNKTPAPYTVEISKPLRELTAAFDLEHC